MFIKRRIWDAHKSMLKTMFMHLTITYPGNMFPIIDFLTER